VGVGHRVFRQRRGGRGAPCDPGLMPDLGACPAGADGQRLAQQAEGHDGGHTTWLGMGREGAGGARSATSAAWHQSHKPMDGAGVGEQFRECGPSPNAAAAARSERCCTRPMRPACVPVQPAELTCELPDVLM
jgi:hypothetical protein